MSKALHAKFLILRKIGAEKRWKAELRKVNIKKFDNPEAYYRDWTG